MLSDYSDFYSFIISLCAGLYNYLLYNLGILKKKKLVGIKKIIVVIIYMYLY